MFGPPDPRSFLRSWEFSTERGLVDAILAAQAGGFDPIVEIPSGYNGYGAITGIYTSSGSGYVARYHERLLHDALIDASIAYENAHMKPSGVLWQKLLISAGAGGVVLIGACAILPGCSEAAVPAALAGAGSGPWVDDSSDVQQGGAVRQTLQGSCVSACGQMLSGGALTESQLINTLGAPTDPTRLAGELGEEWVGGFFQTAADAVQTALRGPMGAVLQVPGQIGHMVVLEPVADGTFLVRDPDPGVTYNVTAEWIEKYVIGGVFK